MAAGNPAARKRAARESAEARPKCPRCGKTLEERHFRTLKVDVCPDSHGVWLDPGELEMILHMPRAEMLRVVDETLQPEFVGLWLREPGADKQRGAM